MLPRFPEAPRDHEGLPAADPRELRVARIVTAAATAWFVIAAAWELFGPILAGHYAAMGGMGIIAENVLRWHIPGPVWEYTTRKPGPELYYCHHPWGTFWTTALLVKLFGRHDVVCRLPAILLSAATPPLLHAVGRAVWRPAAGAAAAAAFVVLPITLAFAQFNALEVPVMAWSLLGIWGFVRMTQTGKRQHLVAAVVGFLLALHADWPGFMIAGAVLGIALARGYLARDFFGRLRHERAYATFWIWTATLAVLSLGGYLFAFNQAGKLSDLFGSYGMRSAGNAVPLEAVLASRAYWIELSFTPIAIALGKVAAAVCALRLLILRREHEALPLAVLFMATAQYLIFKQGADIHVFWPQYFGAYFALGMGALVATLAALLGRSRRVGARAWIAALGVAGLPLLAIARDGVPALAYARATGGRFNEKGNLIDSDGDKTALLHHLAKTLPKAATVALHDSLKPTWAQVWALGGRLVQLNRPLPMKGKPSGAALTVVDTRSLNAEQQAQLSRDFAVTAVGPLWMIDEARPPAPIAASSFREREPSAWAWYFLSGTEPQREIVEDPWLTWEERVHFDQPATPPAGAPVTLAQKRVVHNLALAAGDTARAAALRKEIEAAIKPLGATFDDGTQLLGTTYQDGARPLLTIWIEAGGPTGGDAQLSVRSKVTARAALSTTMADPTEREVALPLAIPATRWKKGFLYEDPVAIRKRPGTEVFRASFTGRGAPKRAGGGKGPIELLRLP
jgi:4-amino-4-deoxy-L-arabinose transferase-like glycosyltransferase